MMEFLYFPDNKLEYLPSIAFLIITLVAAMYTMMFVLKLSSKQERKARELEKEILSKQHMRQGSVQTEHEWQQDSQKTSPQQLQPKSKSNS